MHSIKKKIILYYIIICYSILFYYITSYFILHYTLHHYILLYYVILLCYYSILFYLNKGGLPGGHLHYGAAQRPDVSWSSVTSLTFGDDLWGHVLRGAYRYTHWINFFGIFVSSSITKMKYPVVNGCNIVFFL